MPVRYPPPEIGPSGARGGGRSKSRTRIVAYEEPGISFLRRLLRRLFTLPVLIPLVFLGTIVLGVLFYYWTVFSNRIDNLLKGEVFTRSAGIYAAPRQLRTGAPFAEEDLIAFLKRTGYVEKNQQADSAEHSRQRRRSFFQQWPALIDK